ncbi:hypothetical protein TTHERM_001038803 (macronuclear) [Tetrahymena thermophila SB210]|uniref:Uncharacterized protein n=1 Tax=Tetrahymena thermophila (strain SB210) TaxID=312017 RepID=W7WXA7_TETTS|nr:hypothetical protein TTHERM_001038803 [Tetrahymena thermophila SB210]EWS71445.1 hypothetical protein TTHERM_001038803 [Tetrahymena thermophila SB210]|eukprot:XP_012656011.1 hypothetical protein TTHERM_001038803 [Tetrahymena thermophila SB210]
MSNTNQGLLNPKYSYQLFQYKPFKKTQNDTYISYLDQNENTARILQSHTISMSQQQNQYHSVEEEGEEESSQITFQCFFGCCNEIISKLLCIALGVFFFKYSGPQFDNFCPSERLRKWSLSLSFVFYQLWNFNYKNCGNILLEKIKCSYMLRNLQSNNINNSHNCPGYVFFQ